MRGTVRDVRTSVFLALAFAPILGVLAVAVSWFGSANDRLASLDLEVERMRTADSQEGNRNQLAGALHLYQIAALADPPAPAIEAAAAVQAGLTLPESRAASLDDVVGPLTGAVAETVEADTASFRTYVLERLRAHEVRQPVSEELFSIEATVNTGLHSGSLATLFVQQDRLGESANGFRAVTEFDFHFDEDLRTVLHALSVGEAVEPTDLESTTPARALQWSPEERTWAIDVLTLSDESLRQVTAGVLAEGPVSEAFVALAESSNVAERNQALIALLAVDRQINAAVEMGLARIEAHYADEEAAIRAERSRNVGVLIISLLLGFGLMAASRVELRRRRAVEAAHAQALNVMSEKAYRDQLTGLWNRRWVDEAVTQELAGLADHEAMSFVYLDLDRFKGINDVWGHECGDDVLRNVGRQLRGWAADHPGWEIARFGGDEFVAIVSTELSQGSGVVEELLASIAALRTANDRGQVPLQVQASAGVATGRRGIGAADLVLRADSALSTVKQTRPGTVHYYDRNVSRTGELLPAMPSALDGDEFLVHLQPIVDLLENRIAHVEALARWVRPDGSVVSPGDFVPLAETYGLADRLTAAIVRDVTRVRRDLPTLPRVWINVSPVELTNYDFARRFLDYLGERGLDPNLVGIEVTESAAIRNVAHVSAVLGELRDAGTLIAIDDFGAGYTPLGHLRTLPIDVIKVDRALISHIDSDPVNQEIVAGIYRLARHLDCDVVAEGVERPEELAWLRSTGVRYVQGYLLARPSLPQDLDLELALSPGEVLVSVS